MDQGQAWGRREARISDPENYNYWDDDSTELVHILWDWRRSGKSLEGAGADELARIIMNSEWHAATLAFAADPDLRGRAEERHRAKVKAAHG